MGSYPGTVCKEKKEGTKKEGNKKRIRLLFQGMSGKLDMYLLCRSYQMMGSVVYDQNKNMVVELYGEECVLNPFVHIVEQRFQRKANEIVELEGEPAYGTGAFRIG